MATVWVVGSGASGVHFARTLLERGHEVNMIDVGYEPSPMPLPTASLDKLKEGLADSTDFFLGRDFEGIVLPGSTGAFYGYPPSKSYVFEPPSDAGYKTSGFGPRSSLAQGGLGEAWTAGCYPLDDEDLAEFPVPYRRLEPYYSLVAKRIGVTGADDDLSRFFPVHENLLPPLDLDPHSRYLMDAYQRQRGRLNERFSCYLGRTRVAVLSRDQGERKACTYLARCQWGCPSASLYVPSLTLAECRDHPGFNYISGMQVDHLEIGRGQQVTAIVAQPVAGGEPSRFPVDVLALAAGTLNSSHIFMKSVLRNTGEVPKLSGLMDNRQVHVPFLTVRQVGRQFPADNYQYHLIGLGLDAEDPALRVHGQITALTSASVHPVIQNLPLDLPTATFVFRSLRAALGLLNLSFADTRRSENYLTLAEPREGTQTGHRLAIRYAPPAGEREHLRRVLRRVRGVLRTLGCIVPPGLTRIRPMGSSVHYSGTLPATSAAAPWTTDELCRSRDYGNLYLVDGASFPALPAKNLTFTLMANASRVATEAF